MKKQKQQKVLSISFQKNRFLILVIHKLNPDKRSLVKYRATKYKLL
nr:MAG TPA: hypothetical protein [Caudoviricetes sp.]